MICSSTSVATPPQAVDHAYAPTEPASHPAATAVPKVVEGLPAVKDIRRRKAQQPLQAALVPDALLTYATIAALVGMSIRAVERKVKAGEIGPVVHVGPKCVRIRARDVVAWLASQGPAPAGRSVRPPQNQGNSRPSAAADEVLPMTTAAQPQKATP
jgi:predicted DNA-binding transcriptional regulator AlpA